MVVIEFCELAVFVNDGDDAAVAIVEARRFRATVEVFDGVVVVIVVGGV